MPARAGSKIPKYRLHKPSGQAIVTLRGRDIYLGTFGTQNSKAEYGRLIAEFLAGVQPPGAVVADATVQQLADDYIRALRVRQSDAWLANNLGKVKRAVQPLRTVYGHTRASAFGPKALQVVRQSMIDRGLTRSVVNAQVAQIKRMFAWAVAEEVVPSTVHHGLQAVEGLRKGSTRARDPAPIQPVSRADVDAVLPYVSPQVAAMIELQWFTGMRPGEVIGMRGCDLVKSGKAWLYQPESHKTAHHGKNREIWLGPQALEALKPFLTLDPMSFLFSPKDAEGHRQLVRTQRRRSKIQPSQVRRNEERRRNPRRLLRDHYSRVNYRQAIVRACEKAGITTWSPNQLRHAAATRIRKEYGLEAARVVLGHSSTAMTEVYAEIDKGKALRVMEEVG